MDTTTIQVTKTFKDWLVAHGRYGDSHEQILIRLLGDKFKIPKGDRATKVCSKDDVDSKKTKRRRLIPKKVIKNFFEGAEKTGSDKGGKK